MFLKSLKRTIMGWSRGQVYHRAGGGRKTRYSMVDRDGAGVGRGGYGAPRQVR